MGKLEKVHSYSPIFNVKMHHPLLSLGRTMRELRADDKCLFLLFYLSPALFPLLVPTCGFIYGRPTERRGEKPALLEKERREKEKVEGHGKGICFHFSPTSPRERE